MDVYFVAGAGQCQTLEGFSFLFIGMAILFNRKPMEKSIQTLRKPDAGEYEDDGKKGLLLL